MPTLLSTDGTLIGFDRRGDGPPIVLVDGAARHRAFASARAGIDTLSAAHTLYAYDRRRRGESGDRGSAAVSREIDDLAAVIVGAGGVADVLAEASGGVLALDAAAAGVPIRRLVIVEPPLLVGSGRAPVPRGQPARLERLLAEGRPADALMLFLSESTGLSADYLSGMRQSPAWAEMEQMAGSLAYDARLLDGLMSGEPLPARRWAAVDIPVLVVTNAGAAAWLRAGADALAATLPAAQRRALSDAELPAVVDGFLG